MSVQHTTGPLRIGGKYNWRNQPERLAYMGTARYPGDSRTWHQFEKVDAPGAVWCEVLESDLAYFEETKDALLDPRTAKPRPMLARIAGVFWRWC